MELLKSQPLLLHHCRRSPTDVAKMRCVVSVASLLVRALGITKHKSIFVSIFCKPCVISIAVKSRHPADVVEIQPEVDLQTARNAGMECASVDWGFRTREQLVEIGAEHIFDTVQELEEYLLKN